MESIDAIVQLAMNSGMSIIITVYFLVRDWKYQGAITETLANISAVLTEVNRTIDRLHGGENS